MAGRKDEYFFAPDDREKKGKKHCKIFFLAFVILAILILMVNLVVNSQVRLDRLTVRVDHLPGDLESYSILVLSDLQGEELGDRQSWIRSALSNLKYSCVVMTGDMVGKDGNVQPLLDLIDLLNPEKPKYLIPGETDPLMINVTAHDSLSVFSSWAEAVRKTGVILLDRPMYETRGKGTIWFIPEDIYTLNLDGMEEVYKQEIESINSDATGITPDEASAVRAAEYQLDRIEEIRQAKKLISPDDIQVVVSHSPLSGDYIRETVSWSEKGDFFSLRYADIIIAGHHMGGQWKMPWGQPIFDRDLGWFPAKNRIEGLDYVEAIVQYISPGLGSLRENRFVPGRVFNAPVVTLITLTSK